MKNIVITIDGPSGSGKGTTAGGVAELLDIHHIDSGSIYRTIAFFLHQQNIEKQDDEKIISALKNFDMQYNADGRVLLNDKLVEEQIRSRENSIYTFQYSRNALIRTKSTEIQRKLLENGGVLDGRDAGSVVAPNADLKIYLDCDINERTRRRALQHNITDPIGIAEIKTEIELRDKADMNKGSASLTILPDSIVVDTSGLSVDKQIDVVYQLALKKIN